MFGLNQKNQTTQNLRCLCHSSNNFTTKFKNQLMIRKFVKLFLMNYNNSQLLSPLKHNTIEKQTLHSSIISYNVREF